MNKEQLEAKRKEIQEHLAARLYYLKNPQGNWNMLIMRIREFWYDEAELIMKALSSLGVVLVVEGELPEYPYDAILDDVWHRIHDEAQKGMLQAGYQPTVPLMEVSNE